MIKNIYAAACVVACCMGNPALAQIPGCNLNSDNIEAYNQCIRYTDVLRQQQWQIEEIQRQQQSESYSY